MEDLSLKELKEIATSKGLVFPKNAGKVEIIALLNGSNEPAVKAEVKAGKQKVYLGKCVTTGEPLYKEI